MRRSSVKNLLALATVALLQACSQSIDNYQDRIFKPQVLETADRLSVTWYGAAFVLIDDGTDAILIDPFESREVNSVLDIAFRRNAQVDHIEIGDRIKDEGFDRVRGIFVGHTHYDHSVDVATFARQLDVGVNVSQSGGWILKGEGYPNYSVFSDGDRIEKGSTHGGFTVEVLQGDHGDPPFFIDPLSKTVAEDFTVPAAVNDYGLGTVHSFLVEHALGTILHIGSAGLIEGSLDNLGGKVDIVLLSLVGRPPADDYLDKIVQAVDPDVIIPIHFDNIFRSNDAPIAVVHQAKLDAFFREMDTSHPDIQTGLINFGQPWSMTRPQ